MLVHYRVPLPQPVTDPDSPSFAATAEDYVRRIRDSYDGRASGHRRYYRASGMLVIVAGASLPLLTTLDYQHKSLVISLVGVLVSVVTALRAFYRWDHMWSLLRFTEFSISGAYWKWRGVIADSLDAEDETTVAANREATIRLLEEISEIRRNEATSFFRDLPFPHRQ